MNRELKIIAGPCSVENENQVLTTARELKELGIDHFRAGVWKPRTRPGSFEGMGVEALSWLNRVQQEFGMKVVVEVANTSHVEAALRYGIDELWIGARSVCNPFSIQEIADALKGTNIPIYIKNPLCPDVQLWLGAFERFQYAGLDDITAIHRGFCVEESHYRNAPRWNLVAELKRHLPDVEVLCDPSHMGGHRDFLLELMKEALEHDVDGFMIESHYSPSLALSDAQQQVTPEELINILKSLHVIIK